MLRSHRPALQTVEAVRSEIMWLAALRRDTDLVVPEPVSSLHLDHVTVINVEGIPEPRICILFHWINGRFLDDGLTPAHLARPSALALLTGIYCHDRLVLY